MKFSKSVIGGVTLASASALVLVGCSSSDTDTEASSSAETPTGDMIITTNGSEPQNPLIPVATNETGGGKIIDSIFAGLYYYDATGAPQLEVAESVTTEDNQTFTVTLKDGWTFSDGTPVQAHNFVDAWNWGADPANAATALNSYFLEVIEGFDGYNAEEGASNPEMSGLKVVDDLTFTITLNAPNADFPTSLGYSAFYPLPDSFFEDPEAFGKAPVGNGLYTLADAADWQHDVQIDLAVNESYAGEREVANDGLSIVFYATQDAAYADLLAGNVDVIDGIPSSAMATYEDDLGERAINQPAAIFQSFTIPERLEHFSGEEGKLRRQAISMAFDREQITDVVFQGTRTPASDFTSPVIAGWSDSLAGAEVLDFDVEKAQELWAEADAISPWTGTFELAYNADGGHDVWVDAVMNQVGQNLGIDAVGLPYATFAELRTDVTNRTIEAASRSGWQADYPSLENFLGPIYYTGAGSNDGDYSSEAFDTLIDEGKSAATPEERTAKFQEAQEVLFQDLPAIPLWYSNVTGGYAEGVENVVIDWHSVPIFNEITK
ncbi:peptide ABC transporter substrate-binding protein [Demequina mangrovi]|uniref:Oligopeptide transport system substrate-binding protein n=1 Tax=Demequina mangrovi TaxID=1043493 RepID=A0A1H6Y0T6_9MICO|nr:ABC transporter substrate-binding protein [Demequina mangrovi]SEJ34928.1 oligopeptide transport system substrate-binding protein [Demequina mangrovi]